MNTRVNAAVAAAVAAGLSTAAAQPNLAVQPRAVAEATEIVMRELGPTVENLANAEPLWRSRVLWGAVMSAVGATGALVGLPIAQEVQSQVLDVLMLWLTIGGLVAGPLVTAWGRLRARKPLGA